jgi:Gluconate 2-dehydrogenase subunit 3
VGAVNFIDNILAKEENHHLVDYKLSLKQIDRVLRKRNPFIEPSDMSKELYIDLYNEMATNKVDGWNYDQYSSPLYFLQLLRRHTYTGAFSHPKYGGNVGASGWAYLSERYRDAEGQTLFDWQKAIEQPLGTNNDYRG